jgi:hypothetical protein
MRSSGWPYQSRGGSVELLVNGFVELFRWGVIQVHQGALVPVCFCIAWGLVLGGIWQLWIGWRDGISHVRRLHQIPCSRCAYFSGDYTLKCAVHPQRACSEAAIGCADYGQ